MEERAAVHGLSTERALLGGWAGEAAFKALAPGRRVLHLATHGFFLGAECAAARHGAGPASAAFASATSENPLLRSGLALAGANRRAEAGPADEDGILTAEEVAALDLSGVDWVVLSACDTGRGEVRAAEGVMGLRRAFRIASARTVIMSLWAVDDESARRWMAALYRRRLSKQLGTAEAVRAASREVLSERRARGWSTHPFYWAPFVAAGGWR